MQNGNEMIKRYGDRKALEWFVRWSDEWHFEQARKEDKRYWKKAQDLISSTEKKMTVLIGIGTAISIAMSLAIHFFGLHKSE